MITIVAGPPCAGKTTYVAQQSRAGDVVVDFDQIAEVLGGSSHDHAPHVAELARNARRTVIDLVLDHSDALRGIRTADVWIIDAAPSPLALTRYAQRGARFEVVDPGIETCLSRALADHRPDWTIQEIHRWYATHTGANT
ncbi:hypothetical protein [Rhodococcus ruber]|uniref:hypothetical protein n=1 Tax=Rhodococcus ruber TaxID=1830 RepID=UPI003D8125C1